MSKVCDEERYGLLPMLNDAQVVWRKMASNLTKMALDDSTVPPAMWHLLERQFKIDKSILRDLLANDLENQILAVIAGYAERLCKELEHSRNCLPQKNPFDNLEIAKEIVKTKNTDAVITLMVILHLWKKGGHLPPAGVITLSNGEMMFFPREKI
jgi:hypothetical protein